MRTAGVYPRAMNTFLTLFNAFPAVIAAVKAIEVAVPIPQSGQHKLNLVLGAASAAWELSQVEQSISENTTVNAISATASLAVAGLNAAGVFKKTVPVSSK